MARPRKRPSPQSAHGPAAADEAQPLEPARQAVDAARRARLEREAAALRANLQRRKAQARATAPRAGDGSADAPGPADPPE